MYLVTVNPIEQPITSESLIFCKLEKQIPDAVKKLVPLSTDNVLYVWKLTEKQYVTTNIHVDAYIINEKGEVIPK